MTISGRFAAAALLTASLAACAADPPPAPQPSPSGGMCAASTGKRCTALYPGKEPIRLPTDPADGRRYGAITRGGKAFHTRGGDLPLAPAAVNALGEGRAYPNTIYLATVAGGSVTRLDPVAEIDENAILKAVFAGRVMEGTIGALVSPGEYTDDRTLPIRIEFGDAPADGRLTGKIVNATAGVRGSTGGCIGPLPAGQANPLTGGYTATVQIQRVPAMHGTFDDELVLAWNSSTSNMGTAFYPSVATLLGGDPLEPEWQTTIHGTPGAGPSVNVRLVTGGGGAC